MASITHPFDPDALYQMNADGNVQVTRGNQVGVFTREGIHVSGEFRHADPQLCIWVGTQIGEGAAAVANAKRR